MTIHSVHFPRAEVKSRRNLVALAAALEAAGVDLSTFVPNVIIRRLRMCGAGR